MPSAKTSYFVDTSILICAIDPQEPEKRACAADLLREMTNSGTLVLSPQSLNECYRVITGRRGLIPLKDARRFIARLGPFCTAPAGFPVTRLAWRIQDACDFNWWDCLLLASASLAECKLFFSEDLQHGRRVEGLTIMNPFKVERPFDLSP